MRTQDMRLVCAVLPSGNTAIYDVQPEHVPRADLPGSLFWPMQYGRQVAHERDGVWFNPGGWNPVQDARAIANLNHLREKLWH